MVVVGGTLGIARFSSIAPKPLNKTSSILFYFNHNYIGYLSKTRSSSIDVLLVAMVTIY